MPQKLDGKSSLELVPNRKCDSVPPVSGIRMKRCREQGLLVIFGNIFALNDNVEVPKMRNDLMETTYAMNHWELQSYLVLALTHAKLFRNRIGGFRVVQHKVFKCNRSCSHDSQRRKGKEARKVSNTLE